MMLRFRGTQWCLFLFAIAATATIGSAAIIDDFNDGTWNSDSKWNDNPFNVFQSGNPSDTITFDETSNPGKLTAVYVDTQGSDQTSQVARNDQSLDVGEYVQVKVAILDGGGVLVRPGIALSTAASGISLDRSNTIQYGLRGDGLARAHFYGNGGSEYGDPAEVITGYTAGAEVTLKIVRKTENQYSLYFGLGGPANTAIGTATIPDGATPPTIPGLYFDNGLADFTATFEDFEIGVEPVPTGYTDDFNDGTWNADGKWNDNPFNILQSSNPSDTLTFDETINPGKLTVVYDDTQGSDQTSQIARNDQTLDVGEFVQVKVAILAGSGTLVRPGIALSTAASGISGDRSNTIQYGLRGDGIARAHFYGNGGSEYGDPALAVPGYSGGTEVTLKIVRTTSTEYQLYFGIGANADTPVGTATIPSGALPPSIPGLYFDNGLADFTATFEDFNIGTVPTPGGGLDDFNDGIWNADSKWNDNPFNIFQSGNPTDTIIFDETTNPGKLTAIYDDAQGSDQTSQVARNDQTLDVGEYVQVKTAILVGGGVPVRVGLALSTSPDGIYLDRSNIILFGLRGDGVARAHFYGNFGGEYGDPSAAIPGYSGGTEVTLKIIRNSDTQYFLYYGLDGNATTFVGSAEHPGDATAPSIPGLLFDNGTLDFTATFDDFEMGMATVEPTPTPSPEPTPDPTPPPPNFTLDDFTDGTLSPDWDPENVPQYGAKGDDIVLTDTGGVLNIDYNNSVDGYQVTFIMNGNPDAQIAVGETFQLDLKVLEGEIGTVNVQVGIAAATKAHGIDQDRSNCIYYCVRSDGILRGNFYGSGGTEIGDVGPPLNTYYPGDVVTLIIYRIESDVYSLWYTLDDAPLELAGKANFSGFTTPTFPGIYLGIGTVDFVAEIDNVKMFKQSTSIVPWQLY